MSIQPHRSSPDGCVAAVGARFARAADHNRRTGDSIFENISHITGWEFKRHFISYSECLVSVFELLSIWKGLYSRRIRGSLVLFCGLLVTKRLP